MIYATVAKSSVYAAVASPNAMYHAVSAPTVPVDPDHGLLYDAETGATLYDAVTGLPLTW